MNRDCMCVSTPHRQAMSERAIQPHQPFICSVSGMCDFIQRPTAAIVVAAMHRCIHLARSFIGS